MRGGRVREREGGRGGERREGGSQYCFQLTTWQGREERRRAGVRGREGERGEMR